MRSKEKDMTWYVGLLDKGLSLAGDFLGYLREKESNSFALASETNSKLAHAIDDVAQKLDSVVSSITDKIERDQLEFLTTQAKSVHFALEFENEGMMGQTVTRLMELIGYAKNRIAEGKAEWLGPWLVAESIRLIALRRLAASEKALALVERESSVFRAALMDHCGRSIVARGNVPWVKIGEFVQGANEDVMPLIAQTMHVEEDEEDAREDAIEAGSFGHALAISKSIVAPSAGPSAAVKPALNPAAAWPFPTGSRPSK
jgi:hypothetical protein